VPAAVAACLTAVQHDLFDLGGELSIPGANAIGDEHIARLKARATEEYAAFRKALEEWAKVRDQWVADRKQHLMQKWEDASFRLRLREIEQRLRMQRRRLRIMARATRAYA